MTWLLALLGAVPRACGVTLSVPSAFDPRFANANRLKTDDWRARNEEQKVYDGRSGMEWQFTSGG